MATQPSELYTTIRATALAFVESYDQKNNGNDIKAFSRTLAPTCTRNFAPRSFFNLMPQLREGVSNEGYEQLMSSELYVMYDIWRMEPQSVVVDQIARKAVVNGTFYCQKKGGSELIWELSWMLDLTEDGTKVQHILQYVDTWLMKDVFEEFMLAQQKQ